MAVVPESSAWCRCSFSIFSSTIKAEQALQASWRIQKQISNRFAALTKAIGFRKNHISCVSRKAACSIFSYFCKQRPSLASKPGWQQPVRCAGHCCWTSSGSKPKSKAHNDHTGKSWLTQGLTCTHIPVYNLHMVLRMFIYIPVCVINIYIYTTRRWVRSYGYQRVRSCLGNFLTHVPPPREKTKKHGCKHMR